VSLNRLSALVSIRTLSTTTRSVTVSSVSIAFRLWCPFGRDPQRGGATRNRVSIAFRLWCPFGPARSVFTPALTRCLNRLSALVSIRTPEGGQLDLVPVSPSQSPFGSGVHSDQDTGQRIRVRVSLNRLSALVSIRTTIKPTTVARWWVVSIAFRLWCPFGREGAVRPSQLSQCLNRLSALVSIRTGKWRRKNKSVTPCLNRLSALVSIRTARRERCLRSPSSSQSPFGSGVHSDGKRRRETSGKGRVSIAFRLWCPFGLRE